MSKIYHSISSLQFAGPAKKLENPARIKRAAPLYLILPTICNGRRVGQADAPVAPMSQKKAPPDQTQNPAARGQDVIYSFNR
jgi:hypothetical protein